MDKSRGTWLARGLDSLLGTEKAMRIRTSQLVLATVLMLACIADFFWLVMHGIANLHDVALWAGFSLGGLGLAFGLVRSGFSSRWPDPSLAFAQMLYAIACSSVAFVLAGDGRGVTLPLVTVILTFGMFGLSIRQVLFVAGYTLLLFGAAMVFVRVTSGSSVPFEVHIAYFFMLVIVVVGCSFLTWRLTTMREYMRQQKAQLVQALEKIQQIATRDELTGVANRRLMLELMGEQIQRAIRTGSVPVVALLDIDHFKRVNDTYGHAAGDCCLQTFAKVVQSSIRTNDRLARWGGEEFLILLTDTDFGLALACLERVRTQVAQAVVVVSGMNIRVTVSIGVTQYQPGDSIEKTIERADLALYAAKAQGRDRVVSA